MRGGDSQTTSRRDVFTYPQATWSFSSKNKNWEGGGITHFTPPVSQIQTHATTGFICFYLSRFLMRRCEMPPCCVQVCRGGSSSFKMRHRGETRERDFTSLSIFEAFDLRSTSPFSPSQIGSFLQRCAAADLAPRAAYFKVWSSNRTHHVKRRRSRQMLCVRTLHQAGSEGTNGALEK